MIGVYIYSIDSIVHGAANLNRGEICMELVGELENANYSNAF
jgi:hypothetical protein